MSFVHIAVLLPLFLANTANAEMFKCIGKEGKASWSDHPCVNAAKSTEVKLKGVAAANTAEAENLQQSTGKQLSTVKAANRKREIDYQIERLEQDIVKYQRDMDAELAELRGRKAHASNNLAGATWEQSVSSEMQAIPARYQTKITAAQNRISSLSDERKRLE